MLRIKGQTGITLVELMVALAIGGLLFNLTFNIYLSSWKMYGRGLAAVKINSEARYALRSLTRDIESSFSVRSAGQFRFQGENKIVRDASGLSIRAGSLSLIVPLGESYFLRDGARGLSAGLMRVEYFLNVTEGSLKKNFYLYQAGGWVKDGSVTLAGNVKEVDFRYYDGARWVPEWDNELSPKAIEINLVLHDKANFLSPRRLSTIVGAAVGG